MKKAENMLEIKRLIRQGWDEVASEYAKDRIGIFERSAIRLLSLLNPPRNGILLDVGCGAGMLALQASDWIGSKGKIIGSDIASAMIRLAQTNLDKRGNVAFSQMDAECLGYSSASFDALVCAFSLFQFPDMEGALNEMWRTLKPGGRIGLSNWGRGYFSPIASLQRDLFRSHGIKPLLTNPIVFKPIDLERMLLKAGFKNLQMIEESYDLWFGTPEESWEFNMDMGPFPVMLRQQLSNEQQRELRRQFMTMIENLVTERGIKSTFHVLYAIAERGDLD